MLLFLKLLPLILRLKDVTKYFSGKKPYYYTQRFWGSMVAIIFTVAAYFAIDFEALGISQTDVTQQLTVFATAVGGLYGTIMAVKGQYDKKKREKEVASGT